MPGGLIQIVAYGAQDLFLTSIPEITFFKFLYKRYTNFSMEFIELNFDGDKNFGEDIICTIPKNGDLLKDLILKIELPNVDIKNNNNIDQEQINKLNSKKEDKFIKLKSFNSFIEYIYKSINLIKVGLENSNENFENIRSSVNNYLDGENNYLLSKNKVSKTHQNKFDIVTKLTNINNLSVDDKTKKDILGKSINIIIGETKVESLKLMNEYLDSKKKYEISLSSNYYFSWIENLNYKIIDTIDIIIGGNIIDRQYGLWLYIWNQLFENVFQKDNIDNLKNKSNLGYKFDNNKKDDFVIYTPLKFFFNKNYSLALPLISLRYHEIQIKLTLSKLHKLIYTNYPNNDLTNIIKLKNISLIANYFFLDQDERTKFANANHEYLIEQTKLNQFKILKNDIINLDLELNHPIKYLIWTIQNENDINNNLDFNFTSDLNYNKINNYPNIITTKNNPIENASLELNGIMRLSNLSGNYYNYLQPYECNINIPDDGINFYSFCLEPNKIQPSGSCNLSRIKKKRLIIKLNDDFLKRTDTNIIANIFSTNYNVLRFKNGICGLGFNF